MKYIRIILCVICFAFLCTFACGKVDLQIDSGTYRPDAPPAITLFAPPDGTVADHTNKFVFEWASRVPYKYTLYISTNTDLLDSLFIDHPEVFPSSYMQEYFVDKALPLLAPTTEDPTPKARVYWAVCGERDDGLLVWSGTNAIVPEMDPFAIVISEVCYRVKIDEGTSYANGDFVELHNTTGYSIDVGGWRLRHSKADGEETSVPFVTIPYGNIIPPKGFLVLGNTGSSSSDHFAGAFDYYKFPCVRVNLVIASVGGVGFQFELFDTHGELQDKCNSKQGVHMPKEPTTASHPAFSSYERVCAIEAGTRVFSDGMLMANWKTAVRAGSFVKDGYTNRTWATPGEANSIWEDVP